MILKMSESNENDGFVASCTYCDRKFSYYKNLYIHMRRFHKDKPIIYRRKHKIICSICDTEQVYIKRYWEHIRSKHPEVQLSFEKKFFYTEEDFDKWRAETESSTHTRFVNISFHTLSDGRTVQQLQCDRSGIYNPSPTVSRKHTSKKIGKYCPAFIYRAKTVVDDLMEIEVDFQSTHVGHKFDLHSLRIRSEKHERRLRNKGKGRWPKKIENLPPNENKNNVDLNKESKMNEDSSPKNVENPVSNKDVHNNHTVFLYEKSKTFIKEISDILERDTNTEIQHVTCNCEAYAKTATCGHIEALLKTLKCRKSVKQEQVSDDEDSREVDFTCVDADITPTVENFENPVENEVAESLEDVKASVLEEFQQVLNLCQDKKHLEILKEFVAESRKHLLFSLTNE